MTRFPEAKKSLGQHFLTDKNVINKICQDFAQSAEVIIEIGPGPGVLTRDLAQHAKPFFVVEKDDRMIENLKNFTTVDHIFHQDALEFDWNQWIQNFNLSKKKIWLVSNLPYNISVPLLISFTQVIDIEYLTLMFQKEVGAKIVNFQQEKNFSSSLAILMDNYFETKVLTKVAPGAFSPPPKVDSIVISFKRKTNPTVPLSEFRSLEKFLRNLFAFKRKQIGSVLKFIPTLLPALEELKITRETRAESLDFKTIISLYQKLKGHYL